MLILTTFEHSPQIRARSCAPSRVTLAELAALAALAAHHASLEDRYLELTRDATDYRSAAAQALADGK